MTGRFCRTQRWIYLNLNYLIIKSQGSVFNENSADAAFRIPTRRSGYILLYSCHHFDLYTDFEVYTDFHWGSEYINCGHLYMLCRSSMVKCLSLHSLLALYANFDIFNDFLADFSFEIFAFFGSENLDSEKLLSR